MGLPNAGNGCRQDNKKTVAVVMFTSSVHKVSQNPWFQVAKPVSAPRLRLFCFSYAGGNASTYRDWHKQLPDDVEVCSVQLPGRGTRFKESAHTSLALLLDALQGAIEPHTQVPYVFFGHSMGAQVAFELARRLRDSHLRQPACLIVSGRRGPQRPPRNKPIYNLPEPEFREEIRRLNGTPEEALSNPELMDIISPILRADCQVVETWNYRPAQPMDVPVLALGGVKDSQVSIEDLEDWRSVTTGPFTLQLFSGDHFFINHVTDTLLVTIRHTLDCVMGRADGFLSRN